jgi:dTDP-4-dehydrorhamnose reductase
MQDKADMKVLVFGTTGQVAIELARRAGAHAATLTALGRGQADLTDPASCAAAVTASDADIVINAAAYTAVDQAETDPDTARLVNADAPGAIARACAARDLPFLHISTDYVFEGSGSAPWREDALTEPLGIYGRTKLDGERAVVSAGGPHVILRTAWVFSAHGRNFVRTMLRIGRDRPSLNVVADQHGGPTPAAAIADGLLTVAATFHRGAGESGIFHFAGAPATTWAGFADAIFDGATLPLRPVVNPIVTADYPTPAKRPGNSILDCSKIARVYGIDQPDWRIGLSDVLQELETAP